MRLRKRFVWTLSAALVLLAGGAEAGLQSVPGQYEATEQRVRVGPRELNVRYVKPVQPSHPQYFVVFTTGDGGWRGVSEDVFQHLAEKGYSVAGLSAPDVIKPIKRSGKKMSAAEAAERLKAAFAHFKADLGVASSAKLVVVGFSRGATFVAFTAIHPELRDDVAGAIAIALTREADYLGMPEPGPGAQLEVDAKGRVQIYPALKLFEKTPLAVIQSTGDNYVTAAESRELLGPDTPTRRLYAVDARNHTFGGGREKLIEDLDDALSWIAAR